MRSEFLFRLGDHLLALFGMRQREYNLFGIPLLDRGFPDYPIPARANRSATTSFANTGGFFPTTDKASLKACGVVTNIHKGSAYADKRFPNTAGVLPTTFAAALLNVKAVCNTVKAVRITYKFPWNTVVAAPTPYRTSPNTV